MATKKVCANLDLCGNGITNAGDVTATGGVTASNFYGKLGTTVAALPEYVDLNTAADPMMKNILMDIAANHSDLLGCTLVGWVFPKNLGRCMAILYTYPNVSDAGLPTYSTGRLFSPVGSIRQYKFGTNNGSYYFQTLLDIRAGGTASQFIKGDGSRDSTDYVSGTSIYGDDGSFVETVNAVKDGRLLLQDSDTILVESATTETGDKAVSFSVKGGAGGSDPFYTAPTLTFRRTASGGYNESLPMFSHPCKGEDGVTFVLMNKGRRKQTGYIQEPTTRTKQVKKGWTPAINIRVGQIAYGGVPDAFEFPENGGYSALRQYIKKYYMFVGEGVITDTTMYLPSMLNFRRATKRRTFGIAARRLKNGEYEYSQPAVFEVNLTNSNLFFGIL